MSFELSINGWEEQTWSKDIQVFVVGLSDSSPNQEDNERERLYINAVQLKSIFALPMQHKARSTL